MRKNCFDQIDASFQAHLGQWTCGISPAALGTSYYSWFSQLAQSPGRMLELALYPTMHLGHYNSAMCAKSKTLIQADPRFGAEVWQHFPWCIGLSNFYALEHWWQRATTQLPGLPKHAERTVFFLARQMLNALSPANFVSTNPELFQKTLHTNAQNLMHGVQCAQADAQQLLRGEMDPGLENFVVGKNLAITPGQVVFRNHLIELIQYAPQSPNLYAQPVLMVPAWIMKYYILDLSPHNSLVNWLVAQGHTVFMISWRNPDAADRDLGWDDYHRLGTMAAMDCIASLMPNQGIHLMGYCLGGTLAAMSAAAMAGQGNQRLQSLTLLAAQIDFTEAGELLLFVSESEVAFLGNMMWKKGYLEGRQMAGAFQTLHANELIWLKRIDDLMMKKRRGAIDLLAWNADTTRMPYTMHSDYLEKLFLHNDLAVGSFVLEGQEIKLDNIQLPIFAVGTEEDHVAPWHSVYKVHGIKTDHDITFVLTSGGHNAGIVSEPGHKGRFYHIHTTLADETNNAPAPWLAKAAQQEGSWWLAWQQWLVQHTVGEKTAPPFLKQGHCAAPGTYVLQK